MSGEESIATLFERAVDRAPEAPAVIAGGVRWSYAELDARANRIAGRLRARGIGHESLVGVLADRGADLIAALVGVLKAGGAYVPLDPADPDERLCRLIADARLRSVLHRRGVCARLARLAVEAIEIEHSEPAPADRLSGQSTAADLAYVMYTSGSTGEPKGVAVCQRSVIRLVREARYLRLDATDRVAQVANCAFDAATFEIWGALLNGATLVVLPREVVLDPAALGAALRAERITTLFVTTALFHHVARLAPDAFASLRTLLYGGGMCSASLVRAVLDAGRPERLLHVYGPTETTTFATFHEVTAVGEDEVTIPIGGPIADEQLYVLDARGQPVADGTPGELAIGGSGVARGYLGRPELSAARFVPDAYSGAAGARLFRTGDRVSRRADGALEFLGRLDEQVKIRGHRVEPGEIESALRRHPAIVDAAVGAYEAAPGERRLAANLIATTRGDRMARAIAGYLRGVLPDYMVPSTVVFVDALPLGPTGKVDRARLEHSEPLRLVEAEDPPRTRTERALERIFSGVLGRERVGVRSSFFELGGDSLQLARLLGRVRDALGVRLELCQLFQAPTVELLASLLDGAAPATERPPIGRRADRDRHPIAPEQLHATAPRLLESHRYRLRGPLDVGALERALALILARHAPLRASFVRGADGLEQRIAPPGPPKLELVDLSSLALEERESKSIDQFLGLLKAPVDLGSEPLMKFCLIRLQPEEHLFAVTVHHIVFDGVSLANFWEELDAGYRAFSSGQLPSLPPLTIEYADYAHHTASICAGPEGAAQRARWRARLAGAGTIRLRADQSREQVDEARRANPEQSFPAGEAHWSLAAGLYQALRALGWTCNATLPMTLLAGFIVLIHEWSGHPDIVVDTQDANRDRVGTEPLIGLMTRTIPVRLLLDPRWDFCRLIERVRDEMLDARAISDVPWEQMGMPASLVSFNYHPPIQPRLGALAIAPFWLGRHRPRQIRWCVLDIRLQDDGRSIDGYVVYNAALFGPPTIEARLARLTALLTSAVKYPERPIVELR